MVRVMSGVRREGEKERRRVSRVIYARDGLCVPFAVRFVENWRAVGGIKGISYHDYIPDHPQISQISPACSLN